MTGEVAEMERASTTYKLETKLAAEIRRINLRQKERHGARGPLTTIQKVIDKALEAYMPTLRAIDAAGGGGDSPEG